MNFVYYEQDKATNRNRSHECDEPADKVLQIVRKEKGITLTALVLTIIIIVILTSVSVYTGTNLIREANLQSINTVMKLI